MTYKAKNVTGELIEELRQCEHLCAGPDKDLECPSKEAIESAARYFEYQLVELQMDMAKAEELGGHREAGGSVEVQRCCSRQLRLLYAFVVVEDSCICNGEQLRIWRAVVLSYNHLWLCDGFLRTWCSKAVSLSAFQKPVNQHWSLLSCLANEFAAGLTPNGGTFALLSH